MIECHYTKHVYISDISTITNDYGVIMVEPDHCEKCGQHWLASFYNHKNKMIKDLQKEQN